MYGRVMRHNKHMEEEHVIESVKLPKLSREQADKWIAVSSITGELLSAGNTLAEVLKKSASFEDRKTILKIVPALYAGASF